MKAILIDANERKVVAADVKPDPNKSLDGLRALISGASGCSPSSSARTSPSGWLDEEGRLKLPKQGFRLKGISTEFVG